MSFWSAVVIIAIVAALVHLRLAKYRALGNAAERPEAISSAELEREIVDLKRRLEVMERIVTDQHRSRAVAEEIEGLRDD